MLQLMGIKSGNFKDKDTGNTINYCHLHVLGEPNDDKYVKGQAVEILKVSSEVADKYVSKLELGDFLSVTYNKFGRPSEIASLGKNKSKTSDKIF